MVEGAVVKEYLTPAMIDAGALLIAKLEEIGLPVNSAMRSFDTEIDEWRLLIASPDSATKGPDYAYARIQDAIGLLGDQASEVPFSVVHLMRSDLSRGLKEEGLQAPESARSAFGACTQTPAISKTP